MFNDAVLCERVFFDAAFTDQRAKQTWFFGL
jgi:hypothetical protein